MELTTSNLVVNHNNEVVVLFKEEVVFNFCRLLSNMAIFLA